MDLLVHVIDLENYDISYHREINTRTVKDILESKDVPEEVHIINKVPEKDFCQELTIEGNNNLLWLPVKQILRELIENQSALNIYFDTCDKSSNEKADLFIRIWEQCINKIFKRMSHSKEENSTRYDIFYGERHFDEMDIIGGSAIGKSFVASFPNEVIKKYYPNPVCYIPELRGKGYQQFMDLHDFNKNDFIDYVACEYYLEISSKYRDRLRENSKYMEYLMYNWIDTLSAGLQ